MQRMSFKARAGSFGDVVAGPAVPLEPAIGPAPGVSQQDVSRGPRHHRDVVAGKPASRIALRHCFATHLLESGAHRPGAARTRLDQEHRIYTHARASATAIESTGVHRCAELPVHQPPFEVADVIRTLPLPMVASGCLGRSRSLSYRQAWRPRRCLRCGEYAYRTPCRIATSAAQPRKTAAKLLPVPYFHVVFPCRQSWRRWRCTTNAKSTAPCSLPPQLPSGPSPPTRSISALLSASSPCCTPGARPWCTIPISTAAGGLAPDANWISCRDDFFLPVRVLSQLFRGKMLAALTERFAADRLHFHGPLAELADRRFRALCDQLRAKQWVVYAKPPFGGPEQVLKYRPLHPSCRHRQLKDHGCQFGLCELSLPGLCRWPPPPRDETRFRGVSPSLSAARLARSLRPHPPLRLSRQSCT